MASQERESRDHLEERFFREFYRFSFFKAVDVIERLFPEKIPLGQTLSPAQEAVRFSVPPGLAFPASDVTALKKKEDAAPVEMAVAFMGLIGPAGVLPYWYNELVGQRLQQKDSAIAAFFDMFHHRLISLFYLAWKKYQFVANYESGAKDRFSRYLLSLSGMGTNGLAESAGVASESLIYCSGLLSRQVASSSAVEAAVGSYAETPVHVRQFIDREVTIDRDDQTRLGLANARLGIDTVCGCRTWESQSNFRVDLGPMSLRKYVRFLPTGDMLSSTAALVRIMVGIEYEFDIGIILDRKEVPPCRLGSGDTITPRLGWSTWISAEGFTPEHDPCAMFQESDLLGAGRHKGDMQWPRRTSNP